MIFPPTNFRNFNWNLFLGEAPEENKWPKQKTVLFQGLQKMVSFPLRNSEKVS